MDKIISDSEKLEINLKVKHVLRAAFIDDWKSAACHQHHNFAERRCETIKRNANTLLNRTRAPACTWLLAIVHA